ncbi:UNVERIFIED_CONTAM: hypothetical protein GTU68_058551 [Idotea baltica]|nr:hypothetical protein [Idotea baltica]
MALQLLERNREGGLTLALALNNAIQEVGYCNRCRTLSEQPLCGFCLDLARDDNLLCIVEGPFDIYAIEQTGFHGRYFVLKGRLSPLDGLGPNEIGIPQLYEYIESSQFKEVILATNPTIEGEATAQYIAQMLQGSSIIVSRLAHGIPLGGDLDVIDGGTLSHALAGRRPIDTHN